MTAIPPPLGGEPAPVGEHVTPQDELVSSKRRFWSRFFANKTAVAALGFVLLVIVVAIFAPVLAPYSPT